MQDQVGKEYLLSRYLEFLETKDQSILKDLKKLQGIIQDDIQKLEKKHSHASMETCTPRKTSPVGENLSLSNSTTNTNMVLEIILNQIDAIFLEGDITGVHTVLGKSEEILGYTIEEWMTYSGGPMKFWEDHLHPDHKSVAEECLRLTELGVNHEFVYRMIAKNGSVVWIHDKITVTKKHDGFIIQAFMIDITDKKAVELQMMEQNKFHEIGRIAMGIAHDFNNILAGIVGYTSILEELVKEPEYVELLNGIHSATDQAKQLSLNLLTYGKSHNKLVEVINVNEILRNIKSLVRYKFVNDISIGLELHPKLKAIQADFSQITQILLNLIVNALEAVENHGSVTIKTENVKLTKKFVNQFEHRYPGNYIKIDIIDTGTGIEKEAMERIFDPFFTTKRSGSGLGLSVVNNLIDAHEGMITIDTEVGKGTTFTVYFPSIDQQTDDTMLEQMELHFGKGNILCVDDNQLVRNILYKVLTHLGYDVHICVSGKDGLEYYKENYDKIDAVILDYIIPDLRGDNLYLEMKKVNPNVEAIMVTGYGQEFDINHIRNIGIESVLVKPFKMELLSKHLFDLINKNVL